MLDLSQCQITPGPEFPNSVEDQVVAHLSVMNINPNRERLPSINTLLVSNGNDPSSATSGSSELGQEPKTEAGFDHMESMSTDCESPRLPSVHSLLHDTANNRLQQLSQHLTLISSPTPSSPTTSQVSSASIRSSSRRRESKQAPSPRSSRYSNARKSKDPAEPAKIKKPRSAKANIELQSRVAFAEELGLLEREICSDNPNISSEWTKLKSNNIHKAAKIQFTVKKNELLRYAQYQLRDLKDALTEEISLAIKAGEHPRAEWLAAKLKHAGSRNLKSKIYR